MIAPKTFFEDCQVLVIEKPSGVVVNRAKTVKEETIQDWTERKVIAKFISSGARKRVLRRKSEVPILRSRKRGLKSANTFLRRSGIVHRLDKETSGLLLIAKTPKAFESLKSQFKKRQVKKQYLALVHGEMESQEGEISLPIKRLPWDRKKFGIVPGGKKARTKYKVATRYTLHVIRYSLLEVEPETGRTHQIRVHLQSLGHPVVGDSLYGGRRAKKDRIWCPRLFLHAFYLSFVHPKTEKKVEFESPLPKDLEKILSGLKKV